MSTAGVVHIRDIGIRLGDELVVMVDTLDMDAGEVVVLDAISGAGKSTALGLIAGALPAENMSDAAIHRLSGIDITPDLPRDRFSGPTKLGFVLQTNILIPYLTLSENIDLPMTISGDTADADWRAHLVRALGLAGITERMPTEVSVGQRQRATIARALLGQPDLLLLDEPVSALDPVNVGQVERLIEVLAQDANSAVILASHQAARPAFADARRVGHKTEERGGVLYSRFADTYAGEAAA
ncbi:MAG: ATP-binding cassette domain-containing protein [Litoreibacter sp.]|nr:ATP-binding cassette domain-containing protein [Litoreibacter sp.]